MEYLGFWVTRDGVKLIDQNTSNEKYENSYILKRSTKLNWYGKLIPQFLGKTFRYVRNFN